jgi:hypothetical protein
VNNSIAELLQVIAEQESIIENQAQEILRLSELVALLENHDQLEN